MIMLVTGYEQSSTWSKTQGITNNFPNAFLTSCLETILSQIQVWKEKLAPKVPIQSWNTSKAQRGLLHHL